jgi:hypothetical protein
MAGAEQVSVSVVTASPPTQTLPVFNVGMIAGYHPHYLDRQRTYTSTAAMISDGFDTTEPLYRDAEVYFAQPQAPSQLVVGRRANPTVQVLELVCADTVDGDVYSFQVIGSDDFVHTVSVPSTGVPATDAATIAAFFDATTVSGPTNSATPGNLVLTVASGTPLANGTIYLTISTAGAEGTAVFYWTFPALGLGGTGVVTSHTNTLTGTGIVVDWTTGSANVGDSYQIACVINVGVVTHSSATVIFTQSGGQLNDIVGWMNGPSPGQNLQLTDTSTDPGVTADLVAIKAANSLGWYAFTLDSNSKAEALAASTWADGQGQGTGSAFYFGNNSDYADVNGAGFSNTDVFSVMQSEADAKTGLFYSGQEVLANSGTSMMSYAMGQPAPGRWIAAGKALPGVLVETDTSLTLTQALVLNTMAAGNPGTGGKNGNYYYTTNGLLSTWPGVTPAGQFIDYLIWRDYIEVKIQAAVLAVKNAGPKLSYDAAGLQAIYQAIFSTLVAEASPDINNNVAVLISSIVVTVPTLAQISAASQLERDVPGCDWACTYVGGIQTVESTGSVSL